MDNFTKGLLERNEKRNKALGISSSSMSSSKASPKKSMDKENQTTNSIARVTEMTNKSVTSPRKSSLNTVVTRSNKEMTPAKVRTVSSKKSEDADVAVEINITSTQNVQVEVEVAECEYDEDGKMTIKGETVNSFSNFDKAASSNSQVQLRDSSRKVLKNMGRLYSDTDQISSPIQRTEENFCENSDGRSSTRQVKKSSKLAALATNISSWEDDYKHHPVKALQDSPKNSPAKTTGTIPKTNVLSPARRSPFQFTHSGGTPTKTTPGNISSMALRFGASTKSPAAKTDQPNAASSNAAEKKLLWDKKVMDSLEAQGFTRRDTSGPKLVYDYGNKPSTSKELPAIVSTFVKPVEPKKFTTSATIEHSKPAPVPPKLPSTNSKNVRFSHASQKNHKDPAEMSLKDRMAIFEKNKGAAPVPKTPYGITDANPIRSNMTELSKKFNFGFDRPPAPASSVEPVVENAKIKTTVEKLLTGPKSTISEQQINNNIRKQREEDMKCILNRFNKQDEEDTEEEEKDEVMVEDKGERKRRSSGEKYATEQKNVEIYQKSDDKKRSRVSDPRRLYPVLSDIESTTDSEMDNYTTATVSGSEDACTEEQAMDDDDCSDDEDPEISFNREILNSVKKNNNLMTTEYLDSTVSSADVTDDMDDYLNEALDVNDSKEYDDKGSACSDSFEYERYPKRVSFKEVDDLPIKSKLEVSPVKNPNGSMTLVHTVSFYRRQQSASANNTPVKKIIHKAENESSPEESIIVNRKLKEECDKKIKRLLDEVMCQQNVIKQTSQALNLCASTVEFSGSTEAVEGERHLLVATHRRLACLNEVQRLKVEGLQDRIGSARERGTLSIQEIIVPLKQTYISRLANDEINGHHLLCLVKYNEYVLATKTLPTLPGLKSVKFNDLLMLNEVYADFKITLEIYGMTAQREMLPHEIKYHIQTPNKKRFKSKLQESNLTRPPIQSPGGPNAVRTPALVQYGYIIFSIREIKQKSWVINETAPGVSPLNGNVYLKIDSKITVDVDHCGFLTMFDDISGFGAWHRRWCRLSGNTLYYWKYPEDEKKKEALGQLDLTNIISDRVGIAPRAICARLHTILLESKRQRRSDDVETLVLVPKGDHTTVRHLLAADTKEEREEWCLHLNKSLSLLRSWGHQH